MFDPSDRPRVFGLPPGADFPAELLAGIDTRLKGTPPEALSRVRLIVNTRRMARRIRALYDTGPARLLPRISLVSDLTGLAPLAIPTETSGLRRRLQLAQLVARLVDRQPDLAARASIYDLADSLAALMDEMAGEGVAPETLRSLDVTDMSGHWARALAFIGIVEDYARSSEGLDPSARQRRAAQGLAALWTKSPPQDPILVAGSTGSRGTTQMFMQTVARLPQGAVILPGFDFDQPNSVWSEIADPPHAEDHPQFRFAHLMRGLGLEPADISRWTEAKPPSTARNRLVSLAMRPAPFTDSWLQEGPRLEGLAEAVADVTLLEAPDPRTEALAIAMRLRAAAEAGITAALITPDRMLTRRVSAALDRWNIIPDDSAGMPLHLSPPGRFLRHVTSTFSERLTAATLITLLKHPLCHSGLGRNEHLICSRNLELLLRRKGPAFPDSTSLATSAATIEAAETWGSWLAGIVSGGPVSGTLPLSQWITRLRSRAETLAAGSLTPGSGALWERNAGQAAQKVMDELEAESAQGGALTAREFADLLDALLTGGEVRDRDAPSGSVLIWGTLEARVQGAELLILGGLNEGSWPEQAQPDPWLNRSMRKQAGLLLPERRTGLSAHDFQQAIAAPEVWLTRALRSDDSETVPSRWLNRLVNLLGGLPGSGGVAALGEMRARGQGWLDLVGALEAAPKIAPAPRPSPRPPAVSRPRQLPITAIKTLIRDPYAIYSRHVLRLDPLDPLSQEPDALLRGNVVHQILETFVTETREEPMRLTADRLLQLCSRLMDEHVPWPAARRMWLARMRGIAEGFVSAERVRQAMASPKYIEVRMAVPLPGLDFTLTGRADRIDVDDDGNLLIYDYKTGRVPTAKEQTYFDKQLLIEAALAEKGLIKGIEPASVRSAVFLGVGTKLAEQPAPLEVEAPGEVLTGLIRLVGRYLRDEQGFTARRMMFKDTDRGDFDHLARFGEWDASCDAAPEVLT